MANNISKPIPKTEVKPVVSSNIVDAKSEVIVGRKAIRNLTQKYKKGDIVPIEVYNKWKSMGINVDLMCE